MTIDKTIFGTLPDGRDVASFTVTNANGYRMRCMEYGATLTGFSAPDREGRVLELTLRYDDLEHYLAGHPFFGSTVGRVANRIGGASFELDGTQIRLEPNEGPHMLHSGPDGFHAKLWSGSPIERPGQAGVLFQLVSPAGDQGFPGQVVVTVAISLTERNELLLEYHAETDAPTPLNLTNHAYWNLAGAADQRRHRGEPVPAPEPRGGAIGEHELTLHADGLLDVDAASIPAGRILPVAGTPFDFTSPKPIGADLSKAGEYDHCYVLRESGPELRPAAFVRDPSSGRTMEIHTTSPGIQFYSGNKLSKATDEYGLPFAKHDALCLETQFHPDAPNHSDFPDIILRPGETFQHKTVHRFGVE